MSEIVTNCPRCGAKAITFDLLSEIVVGKGHGWQFRFEAFCVCRACDKSSVFVLHQREIHDEAVMRDGLTNYNRAVNQVASVKGHISLKDTTSKKPPEHVPANIEEAFREGATCMATSCHNAAGTMFRLCIDLATKDILPAEETVGLKRRTRRDLGLRLPWLIDNGLLPESLRELSSCIKDNGNEGAHDGTLTEDDAADILDFTYILLERMYTEPRRVEIAKERRTLRRESTTE